MKPNCDTVISELKNLGAPPKAKASAWFFKTGKGQYGYEDIFYGVTLPEQRKIAKKFADLPLKEISGLLKNFLPKTFNIFIKINKLGSFNPLLLRKN